MDTMPRLDRDFYMETRCPNKLQDYHRHRNRVRKLTRQAKIDYEKSIAQDAKHNPKRFWRYAKSHLKVREGIPDLVTGLIGEDGKPTVATTPLDKAETLATFFTSVFTTEPEGEIPRLPPIEIPTPFRDHIVTEDKVRKLLKQLDPSKAMGPDRMHPRVLQELGDVIAFPLTKIFQTSIDTGIVPQCWREAHVSAIFKKGKKKQPSNYRPVSLTSIVCKLLEKSYESGSSTIWKRTTSSQMPNMASYHIDQQQHNSSR